MAGLTALLIRHGEKPGEDWPGQGTADDGSPSGGSLVVRGWERSGAWAALFGPGLASAVYPQPGRIFAVNPDPPAGDTNPDQSQRPFETIEALAGRLGLTPDTSFVVGQEAALVAEILTLSGVVLVCWEHKAITASIVPALLGGQSIAGVPAKWDRTRFDVVLRFDRAAAGAPWSFQQLFPCLLSGDSTQPMGS
jgi:hypothetical protein